MLIDELILLREKIQTLANSNQGNEQTMLQSMNTFCSHCDALMPVMAALPETVCQPLYNDMEEIIILVDILLSENGRQINSPPNGEKATAWTWRNRLQSFRIRMRSVRVTSREKMAIFEVMHRELEKRLSLFEASLQKQHSRTGADDKRWS